MCHFAEVQDLGWGQQRPCYLLKRGWRPVLDSRVRGCRKRAVPVSMLCGEGAGLHSDPGPLSIPSALLTQAVLPVLRSSYSEPCRAPALPTATGDSSQGSGGEGQHIAYGGAGDTRDNTPGLGADWLRVCVHRGLEPGASACRLLVPVETPRPWACPQAWGAGRTCFWFPSLSLLRSQQDTDLLASSGGSGPWIRRLVADRGREGDLFVSSVRLRTLPSSPSFLSVYFTSGC